MHGPVLHTPPTRSISRSGARRGLGPHRHETAPHRGRRRTRRQPTRGPRPPGPSERRPGFRSPWHDRNGARHPRGPCRPRYLLLLETVFAEVVHPETGRPVTHGETGELILTALRRLGSPSCATGPAIWCSGIPPRFPNGFPGGILGRVDDMVIVRGVNVCPSALDEIVRSIPEVVGTARPPIPVGRWWSWDSGGGPRTRPPPSCPEGSTALCPCVPVQVVNAGTCPASNSRRAGGGGFSYGQDPPGACEPSRHPLGSCSCSRSPRSSSHSLSSRSPQDFRNPSTPRTPPGVPRVQ